MLLPRSMLMGTCTLAVAAIYLAGDIYTEPRAQAHGLNPPHSTRRRPVLPKGGLPSDRSGIAMAFTRL